jgi:hypothetical protein
VAAKCRYPVLPVPIVTGTQCYRYPVLTVPIVTGTQCYRYSVLPVHNVLPVPIVTGTSVTGTQCYRYPVLPVPSVTGTQCYRYPALTQHSPISNPTHSVPQKPTACGFCRTVNLQIDFWRCQYQNVLCHITLVMFTDELCDSNVPSKGCMMEHKGAAELVVLQ